MFLGETLHSRSASPHPGVAASSQGSLMKCDGLTRGRGEGEGQGEVILLR